MDIVEARKVIWVSPFKKPMGELLDSGYLDKDRLEWGMKYAYTPAIQEAAKVLLAGLNQPTRHSSTEGQTDHSGLKYSLPVIQKKISLAKAKTVMWPFPPYKNEPMGELSDTKKISLKDLGFAVENAWEENVRNAALTLMAGRLHQIVLEPPTAKGHIQVREFSRSFSERRQFQWEMIEDLIVGFILGAMAMWLLFTTFVNKPQKPGLTFQEFIAAPNGILHFIIGLSGLVIILCISIFIFMSITHKIDQNIANYRKGQKGEERVVNAIRLTLDGDWSLFRDVIIPWSRGGDLDAVLVGPAGVWVLEVKTLSGIFRNIGEKWECLAGKRWRPAWIDPSRQANDNAIRLANFLKADGITTWVNSAVVWANPESPLTVENPAVAVWKLERLEDELGNISEGRKLSDDERQKIVVKLTKLMERQGKTQLS